MIASVVIDSIAAVVREAYAREDAVRRAEKLFQFARSLNALRQAMELHAAFADVRCVVRNVTFRLSSRIRSQMWLPSKTLASYVRVACAFNVGCARVLSDIVLAEVSLSRRR
jgi:hypothetical protein